MAEPIGLDYRGPVRGQMLDTGGAAVNALAHGLIGNGAADDTAALTAACAAAVASGCRTVVLPADSVRVAPGTDVQGCTLVGTGATRLVGHVVNAAALRGLLVNDVHQDRRAWHPPLPLDRALKALRVVDANTLQAWVENPTRGYTMLILRNNITTTNNSLAQTPAEQTMWRVAYMYDCAEVLVGHATPSASSGAWTNTTLSTGVPAYDSGSYYNYRRSTTIGAWIEYTVTVPEDGYLSVGLLSGSTASSEVAVSVEGVEIEVVSSQAPDARRRLLEYRVAPGARVVRLTNRTATSTGLNVVGCYVTPLRSARPDVSLDALGYYRHSSRIDPIDSNSANDYAVRDDVTGISGGSYHGGEAAITTTVLVDGQAVELAAGRLYLGRSIELVQSCTRPWPAPGPSLAVATRTVVLLGGYAADLTITGTLRARELYTTLVGASQRYTHLPAPRAVAPADLADGARAPPGKESAVEYLYAPTGQRLRITHTTMTDEENQYGGAFLWRVLGSYHKYYYAPVHGGRRAVGAVHAITTVQAS
jgi:hypothetical protein